MKRFSLIALSLFMALQPVLASAYFTSAEDLFTALSTDGSPKSFSAELHGTMKNNESGDTYLAAWISGEEAGRNVSNTSADMHITVDVAVPSSSVQVRAKIGVRIVDKSLYLQLESLTGNYEDFVSAKIVKANTGEWIQVPLSDGSFTSIEGMLTGGDTNLSDIFQMMRTQSASGNSYSVHFTRNFLKQTISEMEGEHTVPNFHAVVNTNAQDEYTDAKAYFAASDETGNVVFTAQSKKEASAPTIVAPTDFISIDTLLTQIDMTDLLNIGVLGQWLNGMPSSSDDTTIDNDQGQDMNDMNWDQDWDRTGSAESSSAVRVSPRTLRNQVREQELQRAQQHMSSAGSSSSSSSYAAVGDYMPALPADGLSVGQSDAPVTIVEFGDYECPSCGAFQTVTFPSIKTRYVDTDKVRFVFRNLPLSFHAHAFSTAMAVECTRDQSESAAWQVHDSVFSYLSQGIDPTTDIVDAILTSTKGVNVADVHTCMDNTSSPHRTAINQDIADGVAGGVSGTPSFWVLGPNGKAELIQGAYPYATFQKVLDGMLK